MEEAGSFAKAWGHRALIVTGQNPLRAKRLMALLADSGVSSVPFAIEGEPKVSTVQMGVSKAKEAECELVISMGGGSAIDAGKAVAAMLTNEGELLDYLEVIGRGQTQTRPSAPFMAIPTTAGTGSEVTRNAVLSAPEHRLKVSMRSQWMLPGLALVDPELTHGLPPAMTASTGLDALTQLIEPYVSSRANPLTDPICVEGMGRVARSLRPAFNDGHNPAARHDMAVASLFGGLALANAGLGAVHGLAGPIGGMFPAPHGAVCAALLPHVFEMNLRALRQRQPACEAVNRFETVARLLTGKPAAKAEQGSDWLRELVNDLRIPGLSAYGLSPAHTSEVVSKAAKASSMKANPLVLTPEELSEALEHAL